MAAIANQINWSDLPVELLEAISNHLISTVDLIRFRSICKSWRFSVTKIKIPFSSIPNITRTTIFWVTLPSSSKGWLLKLEEDQNSGKRRRICPISGLPIITNPKNLDLLKIRVSEIHQGYVKVKDHEFKRTVLMDSRILVLDKFGIIKYWNSDLICELIEDQTEPFSDIVIFKGLIYGLDEIGRIWWVNSSLNLIQYGPLVGTRCIYRNLVESCGQLHVIHRFFYDQVSCKLVKRVDSKTTGFEVFRLDEDWGRWVEVKSLKDRTFIIANDSCYSVLAHEFHGCLKNSIYFFDEKPIPGEQFKRHQDLKVFNLESGEITTQKDCFRDEFEMLNAISCLNFALL